jgi:hypothetical protein
MALLILIILTLIARELTYTALTILDPPPPLVYPLLIKKKTQKIVLSKKEGSPLGREYKLCIK